MIEKKLLVESREYPRLDLFLKTTFPEFSRARIQKAIKEGRILVNGRKARPGQRLKQGDQIELSIHESGPGEKLDPEPLDLDLLYEDNHLLVINKPAGLVVHPGAGVSGGTLANGLIFHYPEISGVGSPLRPGLVHRLDKDTSGVMVVARTPEAYRSLRQQFEDRTVKKIYLALALGRFREKKGIIDLPLGRHVHHRKKISVRTRKPRVAITRYEVLQEFKETSFLSLSPVTGRTHQLRVHLSAIGHPLVGDKRYGGSNRQRLRSPRLFLHAWKLRLKHPASGQETEFESPLPEELRKILKKESLIK